MNDKLVTHADLDAIRVMETKRADEWSQAETRAVDDLLRRLRAAAEADAPPPPEGWVLHDDGFLGARVFWHRDGDLYYQRECRDMWHRDITPIRKYLTPLRPTVTEADVEKAALCYYEDGQAAPDSWPSYVSESAKAECRAETRAILAAAGIEVA